MASPRYPATLHLGDASKQIEVSADAKSLTLHLDGSNLHWPFAETRYRSGGVPRFERGEDLLIVADFAITKAIEKLNPHALSQMENQGGPVLTAGDFLTGLKAVLMVMTGAVVLAAIVWFLSK